jgi:hypothetical protein
MRWTPYHSSFFHSFYKCLLIQLRKNHISPKYRCTDNPYEWGLSKPLISCQYLEFPKTWDPTTISKAQGTWRDHPRYQINWSEFEFSFLPALLGLANCWLTLDFWRKSTELMRRQDSRYHLEICNCNGWNPIMQTFYGDSFGVHVRKQYWTFNYHM